MALGVLARKAKERQIAVLKEEVASAGAAHPLGERMELVASGGFDADEVDGVDGPTRPFECPVVVVIGSVGAAVREAIRRRVYATAELCPSFLIEVRSTSSSAIVKRT